MKIHKARVVKAALVAKTQWGPRLVVNAQLISDNSKIALWSTQLNNSIYLALKPKEIIEVIENAGKFSLLDRSASPSSVRSEETITMSRPSSNESEGSYYTYNSKENPNKDILEELSLLSNNDKKRLSTYISQQSKLYKHIVEIVSGDFPELINVDDRAIRSISMSIFIDCQRKLK